MLSASGHPRGIAIVHVQTPVGRVVLLSDRLSDEERRVAQVMAIQKLKDGPHSYVVIRELEVVSVLAEVAA